MLPPLKEGLKWFRVEGERSLNGEREMGEQRQTEDRPRRNERQGEYQPAM